jgi:RNA-directed DNA polymerase
MNVGEMQRKLSLKAERSPEHKFGNLYSLLCDKDWLRLAHDYVKQNAGSVTAGCDGINMRLFDQDLDSNIQVLIAELKSEAFEPFPVRRVYIPKADGKLRPLGIPSIRDRIVQEALRMILEPIYEADFSQYSFGFRPNRCTMDAIKCITFSTQERKKLFWIIEGDISSYFDTINHRRLVKILRRRIKDEKIIRLIWKFLRAGVMEGRLFRDTKQGTPQGGIVSPLLANIYLNELDRYMRKYTGLPQQEKTRRRKQAKANFAYVRYADDFVVTCNGTRAQAEELKQELYLFLREKLRLKLSKEKTKVTHLNDGFRFLGFRIQRRLGFDGMRTKTLIPKEAVDRLRNKIKAATSASTNQDSVNSKILALNRIIGGWCRYYQYTARASSVFSRIGNEQFWMIGHWLGRKYRISMPQVMKRYKRGHNSFATKQYRLKPATEYRRLVYRKCYLKANPYTRQESVRREELSSDTYWTGYERKPGMADLRPIVLQRDGYICQVCEKEVTARTAQVDHIRPVKRFRRPVEANVAENLWTLCIGCHEEKTEIDRQMESRMR